MYLKTEQHFFFHFSIHVFLDDAVLGEHKNKIQFQNNIVITPELSSYTYEPHRNKCILPI